MRVYITRVSLVVGKEKAILHPRKQVRRIDLLHIYLEVFCFHTQSLPSHSLRRTVGSNNHIVTSVSGKRYALAALSRGDWRRTNSEQSVGR